jgi:hypothetical protein
MTLRVLICYVPQPVDDDGNAEGGARYFSGQLSGVGGGGAHFATPMPSVLELADAIHASKLAAEFLFDSTTLLVIGHGAPVYNAIDNLEFFSFLGRFAQLQSLIFVACELDKRHPERPGFEANVINLLVKSLGDRPKVYASKTNAQYAVLSAEHFVWMHAPLAHLVPTKGTTIVRKNPRDEDVENAMDIFSSD